MGAGTGDPTEAARVPENIRRVRATYGAFERRDYAAMVENFDAAIEVREPPEIPDWSIWRGPDGAVKVLMKLQEAFADMEFRVRDVRAAGDRVLVALEWVGRGVESGFTSRTDLWHLWWFKDGLAVRVHAYMDEAQAIAAMGAAENEP